VGARQGKAPLPDAIVAIDRIPGLRAIDPSDSGLRLGALVTHGDIVASEDIRTRFTALADASAIVGSHATRAQGTIGGNVMNASPAMDTGGPLLCFAATATLRSASGERSIELDELWTGPGSTSARADELLVALDVPSPAAGTGSCYVRLEYRRQMEIAVVGATAVVTVEGGRSSGPASRSRRSRRRSDGSRRRSRRSSAPMVPSTRWRPPRPRPRRPPRRSATFVDRPSTGERWRR
jgi:CO/xanthine dehydrogenase FAD-binding subunit